MLGAFSPEITSSEGRGDRVRMIDLSLRASKFGTILVMLFSVPLMLEMEYVLELWLIEPPPYTASFCQLILCTFMIDRLSTGYMLAVNAHGKIAAYQATLGTALVLTLPLAWVLLQLGYPPPSVGVAFIVTITICSLGRVWWARHLFGVTIRRWLRAVVLPCSVVALAAMFAVIGPRWFLPPSFGRLVVVTATSILASLLTTWFFALTPPEREFAGHNTHLLLNKFNGVWSRRAPAGQITP